MDLPKKVSNNSEKMVVLNTDQIILAKSILLEKLGRELSLTNINLKEATIILEKDRVIVENK